LYLSLNLWPLENRNNNNNNNNNNNCYLLTYLLTAIVLSLGASSPYTKYRQKIRINIDERNNTKTQYKQYKTQ